ncbi:MAG: hypothetical protein AB7K09_09010 [Planctomycetota bacterium]
MTVWMCGEPMCKTQVTQDSPPVSCGKCGRHLFAEDDPEYRNQVDRDIPCAPLIMMVDGRPRVARRSDLSPLLASILDAGDGGNETPQQKAKRRVALILQVSAVALIAAGVAVIAAGNMIVGAVLIGAGVSDAMVSVVLGVSNANRG